MTTILSEISKIKQFFNETLLPIANNNPSEFSIRNLDKMEVKVYYQIKSKLKELEYLDHLHPEEEVISLQILEIKSVKKI